MPARKFERKGAKTRGREESEKQIEFCLSAFLMSLRLGVLA
jgi:hypothetical protein